MSIRLGTLVSGGGTTLQNLLEKRAQGRLDASIELVIADKPGIGALEKAARAGIDAKVVSSEKGDVDGLSNRIFDAMRSRQIDLVVMAGFLRLIRIPDDYVGRTINIHPSLIPSFCGQGFYGERVHRAVIQRGVKVSGCTVHFADNEYDHGPIILQRCVPVAEDDDPTSLAARVFAAECEALPEAIGLFASGRLRIEERRVRILEPVGK